MTPAQLRKELGEVALRVETIRAALMKQHLEGRTNWVLCEIMDEVVVLLREANSAAGREMVAQLTDADRAQATDAAGRN